MRNARKTLSVLGALAVVAWMATYASAQSHYGVAYAEASSGNQIAATHTEEAHVDAGVHGGYPHGGYAHGCYGHGGHGCYGHGGYGHGGYGCGCADCGCGGCGCADGGCGCADCGCGGCGCCCCDPCCRSQGLTYGAWISFLKPHNTLGTGRVAFNDTQPLSRVAQVDPDFDPAYGAWVGWQRCDGLGVRATYWEFDHTYTATTMMGGTGGNQPVDGGTVEQSWDTYSLELAVTDSTKLGCNWDMTLGVGFRFVEFSESNTLFDTTPAVIDRLTADFSGYGMVSFTEVRRQLTCNLGLFGRGSFSVLMGDDTQRLFQGNNPVAIITDEALNDVKFIYEARAGVEYILPLCCGGYYFVRAGGEVQYWQDFGINQAPNPSVSSPFGFGSASTGFGGFFCSAGLQR